MSMQFMYSQYPNDCGNSIQTCGNKDINLNVSGPGIQELINKGCDSYEHNSLWIHIDIEESGTLGFTLTPESNSIHEDYDFWVMPAGTKCDNIPYSIRCSTTNPYAAGLQSNQTGMNGTETDHHEGPGSSGNSFVRWLDVAKGEDYYIIIDRPHGDSKFNLEWTGTAKLKDPLENININSIETIKLCDKDNDGVESYDFSVHNNDVLNDLTGMEISYYKSENDAILKLNPLSYPAQVSTGTYWVRVENIATRCFEVKSFKVDLSGLNINNANKEYCDNGNDNQEEIDLTKIEVYDASHNYSSEFFLTKNDAINGTNPIQSPDKFILNQTELTVYVRVKDDKDCIDFAEIKLKLIKPPVIAEHKTTVCNTELNQEHDLNQYNSIFNQGGTHTVKYYSNKENLDNDVPIDNNAIQLKEGENLIYVKASSSKGCISNTTLLITVRPKIDLGGDEELYVCAEVFPFELPAIEGNYNNYNWSDGSTTKTIKVNDFGEYILTVTDQYNCTGTKKFIVIESETPVIVNVEIQNQSTVIVTATASQQPIHYSLDNGQWQESNIFENVSPGTHSIRTKLENGCVSEEYLVFIINSNNIITPNNDGYNDYWTIIDAHLIKGSKLTIFNRYGKVIYEQSDNRPFIWDGKENNSVVPSGIYWYKLEIALPDKQVLTGQIMVKNR